MVNRIYAFFKKDALMAAKYKFQLMLSIISIAIYVFAILNFSKAYAISFASPLESYLFFLIGYITIDIASTQLNSVPAQVSFYQTTGIIEKLISTNQKTLHNLIFSNVFPFMLCLLRIVIYSVCSFLMFRIDLDLVTFYVIIFALLCIASSYLGVGLIAASFTILFKRGNPIIVLFMAGTALISGAFYSNSLLPDVLLFISEIIPATSSLELIRNTIATDELSYFLAGKIILITMTYSIVGYAMLYLSLKQAKKNGEIFNY